MLLELLPNWIAIALVAGLATVVALRRPPRPLWPVLMVYLALVELYLIGDTITLVSTGMVVEQLGIALLYTGSIPAAFACWLLTIRYAEAQAVPFTWARGPWIWGPLAASAVAWAVMITNPWHGHFLTPVIGANNIHQPLWFPLVGVGFVLAWGAFGLFVALALRATDTRMRLNALLVATGIHATLVLNFVSHSPRFTVPFDLTVLGLAMTSLLFLYGAYYSRLFGLLPVALREILHHEADGVMLVEPDGRWIYWNPAAERMLTSPTSAGRYDGLERLREKLRDADGKTPPRDLLMRTLLVADLGRPGSTRELGELRLTNGRWVDLQSTPLPSRRSRKKVVAYSLRLHDVTELRELTGKLRAAEERQRLEQRLARAQRLESLGVLAGGIAHDFNNLLAVVLGNAQLALDELDRPERAESRLTRIHEAGRFAAQLSDQLLTSSGRREPTLRRVNVSVLGADLLDLLQASIAPQCRMRADFAADLPDVEADSTQLRQVVMNLVRNAADAMGSEGGEIHVRTSVETLDAETLARAREGVDLQPGAYVVLEVEDSGPGMDESTQEHVFEPFFTTRRQGRGLGLAAVHGIVQAHQGGILLDTAPGRGCRFRVVLRARPRATTEPTAPEPAAAPHEPAQGRVLVVDDEVAIRELSTYCLERAGFTVSSAASGEEALEQVDRAGERFDAIVLDLEMPGIGGGDTFRQLSRSHGSSRVVLVSGYSREQVAERFGIEDGAHAFLRKPCEFDELVAAVRSARAS